MVSRSPENTGNQSGREPVQLFHALGELVTHDAAIRARSAADWRGLEHLLELQAHIREIAQTSDRPTDADVVNHVDQAVQAASERVAAVDKLQQHDE